MDRSGDRIGMLRKNMELLKQRYPDYKNDSFLKGMGAKKKIIFSLLDKGFYEMVLKIYDR